MPSHPFPPLPARRLGLVSHSVIAAFAVGLAASHAGEVRAQEGQPVALPPISVEGQNDGYKVDSSASPKFTQPLLDTPRTVTIITDEMMEDMGATSLRDVLRTQPGITLDSGEGGASHSDRMFIRGFSAENDVFVDGARDRGPQFRDPFNMEQVEIVKGPGGAYAGRGSTGGMINLVSKTPKAVNFGRVEGTLGNAENKRGTIDVNRKLDDNQAFRFNFMYHDGEVAGRDEVDFEKWGFAPSYTLGLNGPTQLTLSYYHLSQDDMPDYGHPYDPATGEPVAVDRENFYGLLARDFQEIETDIASATLDHRFSDMMSLRNLLRINRTNNNYIVTKPNYTGGSTVEREVRSRDDENLAISNQTDLILKFQTGNVKHDLVTGMELAYERSETNSRSIDAAIDADLFNPNPSDPYTGSITYSGNTETTADTVAFYAFDTAEINPQFEVSGGLRWDYFDAENSTVSRTDKLTSYQIGAVYKPAPNGSIYVSHSVSYNPSAESVSLSVNNANTDPEETKAYELGTKWDLLDDRLSVTAAIFRTHKTNARVNSAGRGSPQVLEGEQRVDGIELGVTGQLTPAWNVFAGYTFLDSEIVEDAPGGTNSGNEFGEVAPHIFSVWSTYQIDKDWKVGGGAYYSAARKTSSSNASELPSYWRFDAMASWQLTEKVDVRLNVLNLFDKTYYDSTHSTQFAYVAPGRTILVSTGFDF